MYLLDHPNPTGPNYYPTRRKPLIAIVVHVTAGLEDKDLIGPDMSCENVCRYAATTTRDVSWHSGSDSDTWIDLLPYSYTAWQCVDYNSSTAGHEISKLDTDWRDEPKGWVDRTINIAALGLGRKARENHIPIRKASKAEVDRAIANGGPPVGFISHHELDPSRRTDPGWVGNVDTFPWEMFLAIARGEEDPMAGYSLADDSEGKAVVKKLIHDELQGAVQAILKGGSNSVFKGLPAGEIPAVQKVEDKVDETFNLLRNHVEGTDQP